MNPEVTDATDQTRVLVVEDDRGIAESLVRGLRQAGYAVEDVRTGRAALAAPSPDVVLLDLGLPDIDGVEVCRRLRARSTAAIIAVTARGEEADRVVALDEGADDYLVKPFDLRELEARMRAVVRRHSGTTTSRIEIGNVTIDIAAQSIVAAGQRVELTRREFRLLELLILNLGQVVARERLMDQLFGYENAVNPNALELYVSRIRRRLKSSSLRIETVWGTGYVAKIDHERPSEIN